MTERTKDEQWISHYMNHRRHPHRTGRRGLSRRRRGLRVVEYVLQPRETLPWHHHSEVTDRFYCLEGLVGVDLRTPAQNLLLHPGESCTVAPGIVHRSGNAAAGISRYLLVQGVGRYDFVTADCEAAARTRYRRSSTPRQLPIRQSPRDPD